MAVLFSIVSMWIAEIDLFGSIFRHCLHLVASALCAVASIGIQTTDTAAGRRQGNVTGTVSVTTGLATTVFIVELVPGFTGTSACCSTSLAALSTLVLTIAEVNNDGNGAHQNQECCPNDHQSDWMRHVQESGIVTVFDGTNTVVNILFFFKATIFFKRIGSIRDPFRIHKARQVNRVKPHLFAMFAVKVFIAPTTRIHVFTTRRQITGRFLRRQKVGIALAAIGAIVQGTFGVVVVAAVFRISSPANGGGQVVVDLIGNVAVTGPLIAHLVAGSAGEFACFGAQNAIFGGNFAGDATPAGWATATLNQPSRLEDMPQFSE
mmetsp:Transcript_15069/g.32918  ORF Transcript_15069/g.32918 Transcript_15069/m.32918 type:complete len:321 (-) Transcript_15069:541-1503(-)